jgi:AraC-like DNA-binding protein
MNVSVGLAGCRIIRPRYLAEQVEIAEAAVAWRSFPPRISEALGICVKTGPTHRVDADGRRLAYPRDAVCVRPPGCIWSSETGANGFLSVDVAPSLLPEPGIRGSMTFLPPEAGGQIRSLVGSLVEADSVLQAGEVVAQLIMAVADGGAWMGTGPNGAGARQRAVARARDFLDASLADRPSLDAAALAAGVSKFVLVRYFRSTLNTTPHAYLVMLRLNRARELLARGASASEAAQEAGFSDQAHLSRWLTRTYGVTPATYARQVRSVHSR